MLQLDGLRALAILGVMLHHFDVKPSFWFDWGPVAPTVFFILSGVLITLSLLKMRERGTATSEGLLGYHLKRMTRLGPALYLMLCMGFLLGLHEYREGLWWHALFLSNIQMGLAGEWSGSLSHLWSLAKLEQFYLLWPLLFLLPIRGMWIGMAACVLAAIAFRITCIQLGTTEMFRWMMLPGSLDAFAVGGLIALAIRSQHKLIPKGWGVPAVLLAVGCWIVSRALRAGYGSDEILTAFVDVFEVACFGILIIALIQFPTHALARILASRPLALLGKISYGLFIWHVMVVLALDPHIKALGITVQDAPLLRAGLLTAGSIVIAALSWTAIERPSIAWSKSIESSGAATSILAVCRSVLNAAYDTAQALLALFRPRA